MCSAQHKNSLSFDLVVSCTVTGKINSALTADNNTAGMTETLCQLQSQKKKVSSEKTKQALSKQAVVNF